MQVESLLHTNLNTDKGKRNKRKSEPEMVFMEHATEAFHPAHVDALRNGAEPLSLAAGESGVHLIQLCKCSVISLEM